MSVWARTIFRVLSTVIGAIALLAPATQLHAGEAVTRSFHMGFTPAEYDVTSARRVGVPDGVIQLLHVWESNGLVDAAGRPRQAFRTWSDWLRLPKR